MNWRDKAQKAAVCRTLSAFIGLEYLWDENGPSDTGAEQMELRESPLSKDEEILLFAAWAIWEDDPGPFFQQILSLPEDNCRALGELIAASASGAEAVDEWLSKRT